MPLQPRPIAISAAVLCFFAVSIIGWFCELSPFVSCKRALVGAIIIYIASGYAVRAINAIIISALVNSQIEQQKEPAGDNKD